MCGRYNFSAEENDELRKIVRDAARRSGQSELNFQAGDIVPGYNVPVLIRSGEKIVGEFQSWGIRNQYGKTMINARAETVTDKPMFRRSIAAQRCVIPTSGFYEWDGGKHKYYFSLPGQPSMYLAGIYDSIDGVNCFVILTTAPNESMSPIHDRMPLVLTRDQIRPWLTDSLAAMQLLAGTPPLLDRVCTDGQMNFGDLT